MSRGRLLIGVVVATGTLALVSACGGSGYQYVENEDRGVFARLPDDWTVYDEDELFESQEPPKEFWYRGFDASEHPSIEGIHSKDLAFDHPQGFVQIQPLTDAQSEQVNISMLRGFFLEVDPLASMQQQPDGPLQVLGEEPANFDGGYHGVHTLVTVGTESGLGVVDQTIVLNETNTVVYAFVVACSDRCYTETHKDEIAKVVDSWTIEEDGS
jgi:hypothetical protein